MIPYGRQSIDEQDRQALLTALDAPFLTQGPTVERFEAEVAAWVGARHGVAVNSGTAALHIACLTADVGPGDEVVTSPITFVASANCAVYCGATPVFADIDPHTGNLDPPALEQRITARTRAVIPVHYAGQSCDMARIHGIVRRKEGEFGRRIAIIEDACHALGSACRERPVGSGDHSEMTVFSFHPVKHITTGEGGMVVTNDAGFADRLKRLRSHGIARDDGPSSPGPWHYDQVELGFNYRITDLQCALGLAQLARLPRFRRRRRAIADRYHQALGGLPFITPLLERPECDNNLHLYVLRIDFAGLGRSRAEVMRHLEAEGIRTQVHYIPVFTHSYYRKRFPVADGDCPQARRFYDECLSIPLFPGMSDADVERVIDRLTALVRGPA